MEKRKPRRVIRNRPLTPEEVAKDQEVRRKVQEEFPPDPRAIEPVTQSVADSLKQAISASDRSVYQIAKESGSSFARYLHKSLRQAYLQLVRRSRGET